jgi:hypothetical protein
MLLQQNIICVQDPSVLQKAQQILERPSLGDADGYDLKMGTYF